MKIKLLISLFFPLALFSQTPEYYSSIDFTQTGEDLKAQLTSLITETHINQLNYTSSNSVDTWDVIKQSDLANPTSDDVLLIYGFNDYDSSTYNDRTRHKDLSCHNSSCIGMWNREHVYPRSLADPRLDTSYPSAGTDVHNLRSCDSQMNSSRSNRIFQDGRETSHITPQGNYYPGDEHKGDVARIIMYMYTRYPDQCRAIDIGYGTAEYSPLRDMPDVFLKWNVEDPVSDFERRRNEIIYEKQGNRNPFIDNPYLATLIWSGEEAEDTWGSLSISETEFNTLSVYPTYTHDYVYISNDTNDSFKYYIYNTLGQEVQSAKTEKTIDVFLLKNGIYLLHIESNTARQVVKIVKSN